MIRNRNQITYAVYRSSALIAMLKAYFPLSLLPTGQYTRTLTPVLAIENIYSNKIPSTFEYKKRRFNGIK